MCQSIISALMVELDIGYGKDALLTGEHGCQSTISVRRLELGTGCRNDALLPRELGTGSLSQLQGAVA